MASNVLSNEKQEKVKVDKETSTPTPLTDIKCKQRHHSAEHGSTGQPPLHFDMAKNGMAGTHAHICIPSVDVNSNPNPNAVCYYININSPH